MLLNASYVARCNVLFDLHVGTTLSVVYCNRTRSHIVEHTKYYSSVLIGQSAQLAKRDTRPVALTC